MTLCWVVLSLLFAADERKSPGYSAYEKANGLFAAQKFKESRAVLEEALRLEPKLAPAWTLKAKLALAVNDFPAAKSSLEKAIESDASSAYAHFLYGLQFFMQNDLRSAAGPFEKARQLNRRDARAPLYLGLTSESLGKNDEALVLYREAVRLEQAAGQPQPATLLIAARLMLLMSLNEEAALFIYQAVKLDPKSRDARFELARLLLSHGDAAGAAKEGEAALSLPGGEIAESQIRFLLVRAYRALGEDDKASKHADALRAGKQ